MSSKQKLYAKIKATGNLPTLPEVLLKILSACESEDTSIGDIANIIEGDPSLSAKVLQLVNSSYYGLRQSFSSIDQAVIYLGANTIKNLAVTMSVHQFFGGPYRKKYQTVNPALFWYQSLTCACIAKALAHKTGVANSDEAYLGGLLHNIGILTIASTFPEQYKEIAKYNRPSSELIKSEEELLGVNHCEAGSWILKEWKLNPILVDAILYHHAPLEKVKEAFSLVQIVYIANEITENQLGQNNSLEGCHELFSLTGSDIDEIIDQADEEVEALATNLGVDISVKKVPQTAGQSQPANEEVEALSEQLEKEFTGRIKNISLLSNFLERLIKATDPKQMMQVFEESVHVLFEIDAVLFFLPDPNNIVLHGKTSDSNRLVRHCNGLTLPLNQGSSYIIHTYQDQTPRTIKHTQESTVNLADQQILSLFGTEIAATFPLHVNNKSAGVVIIGFSQDSFPGDDSNNKLLTMLVQQLALSMNLEKERREKAQEIERERMAAISMTAKKFAHEINNPLGIISNYLVAMKMKSGESSDLIADIEIINEEIDRISSMINQMQLFAQAPFEKFAATDLNKLLSQVVQLTKSSLFSSPDLSLSFAPGSNLPVIMTVKDAIKQILINLLKNSAEAMTEGGRVIVRTQARIQESTGQTDSVDVIISDNGPGLPEQVKANLFKPFVSTKQGGHPGLGLSIVQKAVSDIGGQITCTSNISEGTTFTISLPHKILDSV